MKPWAQGLSGESLDPVDICRLCRGRKRLAFLESVVYSSATGSTRHIAMSQDAADFRVFRTQPERTADLPGMFAPEIILAGTDQSSGLQRSFLDSCYTCS